MEVWRERNGHISISSRGLMIARSLNSARFPQNFHYSPTWEARDQSSECRRIKSVNPHA